MYRPAEQDNKLTIGGIAAEELVREFGSPLYVYDAEVIRGRYRKLNDAIPYAKKRIHFAMKANSNIHVLRLLEKEGAYIDAVSVGEVMIALTAGFQPDRILFTGLNFTDEDIRFLRESGVMLNIGSLRALERYGSQFPGTEVSVRINPDMGAGHHSHVITGGRDAKFGIFESDIPEAKKILAHYGLKLAGIHCHIGSGVLELSSFTRVMKIILRMAGQFEGLRFVDFGGGIGVAYEENEPDFDLEGFGREAAGLMEEFAKESGTEPVFAIEPGRYLVAESGYFLVTVRDVKHTPKFTFVGVDSGFNHLIRPMAYGSYHPIVNASKMHGGEKEIVLAGYLCESGDVFTRDEHGPVARKIAMPEIGDVVAILIAGAYGFAMASQYNSQPRPAEVLVDGGKAVLVRRRETIEDLTATLTNL